MPTNLYPNAEKVITAADITLTKDASYDMKMLYKAMHEWLIELGYATTSDKDFNETLHLQRTDADKAREIIFWWRQEKRPADAGDRFIYFLKINVHILGMKKVEVVKQGKKYKLDKGECEIAITGKLIVDPYGKYKSNFLIKKFKNWFMSEGMDIGKHKHLLYRDVYEFANRIRNFWEMQSFAENREGLYYPPSGIEESVY